MSVHGRASIDARNPNALGICERCGFLYNHNKLKWQGDWRGTKIQNLRKLVCQSCYDAPQQNGNRVIVLPPDPIPIMNARAENYVVDSNPLSGLNMSPDPAKWRNGSAIGTLTEGGGPQAAFDANTAKSASVSAVTSVSNSSYRNYVGINWGGRATSIEPSSVGNPAITHTVTAYVLNAPVDSTFGSTGYLIQGSQMGSSQTVVWVTIASGTFAGTVGEQSSGTTTGGRYPFHRVAFYDNGGGPIYVAQVAFSVADGSSNGQGI